MIDEFAFVLFNAEAELAALVCASFTVRLAASLLGDEDAIDEDPLVARGRMDSLITNGVKLLKVLSILSYKHTHLYWNQAPIYTTCTCTA